MDLTLSCSTFMQKPTSSNSDMPLRHRRTQDVTIEEVYIVGAGPGSPGDGSPAVGSRGKAPVGSLGDKVPQKLKQNVKLAYNF